MPNQNWIQILVVLVMILGPAFGKMLQVAQKKAAEAKRRTDIERRRELELRTGRDAAGATIRATPQPEAKPDAEPTPERTVLLEEIARRRQEQIEAMRRRAEGKGAPTAGGPPRPAPTPARPQRPPSKRPSTPRPPQHATQRAPQRAKPTNDRPARQATAPAPRPARPTGQPVVKPRPVSTPAATLSALPVTTRSAAADAILGPQGQRGSAWRRAIILNEILSRPVGDRPADLG